MPSSDDSKSTITNTTPSADPQPTNDTIARSQEDLSAQSVGVPHPNIHTGPEMPASDAISARTILEASWDEGAGINTTTALTLSLPGDEAQVEVSRDRQLKRPDTIGVVQPAPAEGIKDNTSNLLPNQNDQPAISQDRVQDRQDKSPVDLLREAWSEGVKHDTVTLPLASRYEVEISRNRTREQEDTEIGRD